MTNHEYVKGEEREREVGRTGEQVCKNVEWGTASYWGRRIHINKRTFDSYLLDMGYLERISKKMQSEKLYDMNRGYSGELCLTLEGLKHCKEKRVFLGRRTLWDFDTYLQVAKRRVENADIHDICPSCKAFLDTVPGYKYMDVTHKCSRCGRICKEWGVSMNFDR